MKDNSNQFHDQHVDLRESLGDTHRLISHRSHSLAEVADRIRQLTEHILEHFEEEEQESGLFTHIIQRAPHLALQADQVMFEHEAMRQQIAQLHELCTSAAEANSRDEQAEGNDTQLWAELEKMLHDVGKQLMAHENREMDLLQQAYTVDIGAQD